MAEEEYVLSAEEKLRIANAFLLNSPPGEFGEVVTDVRTLVNDDDLLNKSALDTFKKYNESQLTDVTPPGGDTKVVICAYGSLSDTEYLHPRAKQVVSFDHFKGEVTDTRDATSDELGPAGLQEMREAVEAVVNTDVMDHYPAGGASVFAREADGANQIIIAISSAIFSPRNFWNGRWRSVWTLVYKEGDKEAKLVGKYKVDVHYYEDGNVQLSTGHDKTIKVKMGATAEATAKALAKALVKEESRFQGQLDEHYTTMSDTTFKALRRNLPLTKKRMEWSKLAAYKLTEEL